MKMKLKDVTMHYRDLEGLGSLILPSGLSFTISRNMDSLRLEVERMEKERKKLCERYAEKDDDGNPAMADSVIRGEKTREYKMLPEARAAFSEEYEKLLETEVEVPVSKAKREYISQCEEKERYSIPSVGHIAAMTFMLEE